MRSVTALLTFLKSNPKLAAGIAIVLSIVFSAAFTGRLPLQNQALADSTRIVSLYFDGQNKMVSTDASTVGDVLNRAGVTLGQNDLVEPGLDTYVPQGFFNVNIYRARPVVVVDGNRSYTIRSALRSPKLLAEAAGLTVYPEDSLDSQTITDFVTNHAVGQQVVIHRATPVTLSADGKNSNVRTQAQTVGGLLQSLNLPLGPKDTVTPSLSTLLHQDTHVVIVRVNETVLSVDEVIPKTNKTVQDPNQPKGYSKVQDPGADGHRHVTYRVHFVDGKEVHRDLLKVDGQTDPKPQITIVGTKIQFRGSVEYWRPLVIDAATANGIDPNKMLRIMQCESNGNALASNGTHFGLFQYDWSTWFGVGGTKDNIYDGPTQIQKTAWKMAHYGYSAWVCQ